MLELNTQRINWGIAAGYLSSTSKGVTKLIIDGIPCLLMDIVLQTGERLQTYTFFISKYYYGNLDYSIIIKTQSREQSPHVNLIKDFVYSLRIKIPSNNTKCVFKSVMTDKDLVNCGIKPSSYILNLK